MFLLHCPVCLPRDGTTTDSNLYLSLQSIHGLRELAQAVYLRVHIFHALNYPSETSRDTVHCVPGHYNLTLIHNEIQQVPDRSKLQRRDKLPLVGLVTQRMF